MRATAWQQALHEEWEALGPEKAGNALPKGLDSLVLGQAVGEAARWEYGGVRTC